MNRSGAAGVAAPWKQCIIRARGNRAVTRIMSNTYFSKQRYSHPCVPLADTSGFVVFMVIPCFVALPSCCFLCWFFGELRLIASAGTDSPAACGIKKKNPPSFRFLTIGMPIWSCDPQPGLPTPHTSFISASSSLFLSIFLYPPFLFFFSSSLSLLFSRSFPLKGGNRAGQGIRRGPHRDAHRERPWVLHSKSTVVERPTGPCGSHLERGQGEDESWSALHIGPWSPVTQNRRLLAEIETFSGLMDVYSWYFTHVSKTKLLFS